MNTLKMMLTGIIVLAAVTDGIHAAVGSLQQLPARSAGKPRQVPRAKATAKSIAVCPREISLEQMKELRESGVLELGYNVFTHFPGEIVEKDGKTYSVITLGQSAQNIPDPSQWAKMVVTDLKATLEDAWYYPYDSQVFCRYTMPRGLTSWLGNSLFTISAVLPGYQRSLSAPSPAAPDPRNPQLRGVVHQLTRIPISQASPN